MKEGNKWFYGMPKLFKQILKYSEIMKWYPVRGKEIDYYAYRAAYSDIMEIFDESQDEIGTMKLSDLMFNLRETREEEDKMIFEYVDNLLTCKWFFHLSPYYVEEDDRWIQPIFDPGRMTEEQYNGACEAIQDRDYKYLIEVVKPKVKINLKRTLGL